MDLNQLIKGIFKKRINRFVAEIELEDGSKINAHLANTGRMKELLIKDSSVLLKKVNNINRKTNYDLLFIQNNENKWIMLKASYANDLFLSWLNSNLISMFTNISNIAQEVKIGNSRFDFLFDLNQERWIIEVKSVNYFQYDYAIFPDAPTRRGAKHIKELIELKRQGYKVALIFILMGGNAQALYFNCQTDPEFASTIHLAIENNIFINAYQADFNKNFPFYNDSKVKIGGIDGNLCINRF